MVELTFGLHIHAGLLLWRWPASCERECPMKKATLILCSAAMTLTSMAADAASPLRPMAIEAPSVVHQVGDYPGFYGGRGYYRRGFYGGGYRGGYGGYHGGYGHYDNFSVPGAAFVAGAIIGGIT